MIKDKKAQITIFIIIGILMLLIAGIIFYIISLRGEVSPAEIEEAIEEAPEEIKPVSSYITSCIDKISTEGINRIGQHGGYIDMLDAELSQRQFDIDLQEPTESDAVALTDDESTHVAYWWQMKTENDCLDCLLTDENRPSIEQVEEQMELYIKRELDSCIDDFRMFSEQGYVINKTADTIVDVEIAREDISIFVTYPISATVAERTTELERFFVRIPLRFQEFYDLADDITAAQVRRNFLEDVFLYLLSVYSSPDMNRLPPIFAREFGSFKKIWVKTVVAQKIQDLLSIYVPLIQLAGTSNSGQYIIEDDAQDQAYYSMFYKDILNQSYSDYQVRFLYLNQPIYLHTNPDGKITSVSEVKVRELDFLGFSFGSPYDENIYEYLYDVSFPVIVEIRKENAIFDRPYVFYFALEGNVRNNKGINDWMQGRGTMAPFDREKLSKGTLSEVLIDEAAENISFISGNITKSIFCNPKQRISGNVTIITSNQSDGSPVQGTNVKFGCGNHRECSIGSTDLDIWTNTSRLTAQFPVCLGGGYLKMTKEGFRDKIIPGITTMAGQELEFDVKLEKIVEKQVTAKKFMPNRTIIKSDGGHELDKWLVWNNTVHELNSTDQLILTVTKIDVEPYEYQFSSTLVLYGNDSLNTPAMTRLDLVPGIYAINGQIMDTAGVTIPKECGKVCDDCLNDLCELWCLEDREYNLMCAWGPVSGTLTGVCEPHNYIPCGFCKTDDWQPDEEIVMQPVTLGGIEINESAPWTVTYETLESGDEIEFRVISAQMPRCVGDLNETEELKEFYVTRRNQLNPRFI